MEHDRKLDLKRAYLRGYADALKLMTDAAAERRDKGAAVFLARETFEDDETRRLVEGALRVER